MRYRDVKTGATIETDSVLGGDWLPEELVTNSKPKTEPQVESEEATEENLEALNVAELKARLDELGVTYPTKAKKQDLIEILSQF